MTEQPRIRHGRFVEEPLPHLCDWVAHPDVPSPAGGTVTACCAALAASLTELIARVAHNRLVKKVAATEGATSSHAAELQEVDRILAEANALRVKLLEYGEGDVYAAARIIQGDLAACVRKDVGSPAKIAGTTVKLLRLLDGLGGRVPKALHSDLRVVTYLSHAAVYAICEIAEANIRMAGGADDALQQRIDRWRLEATDYRDRVLTQT
ncbi:cyclodeaminase/cyclohydrolase family protein [Tumebacillus permanentifrigoris]|uniref:Formiminotetrahydrofolate cyclodeaminase n=1 Tax=Tumebacillus permanentifrigoris TaxID=378543 RepID=A0A316DBR9_9BACL|nr:cyclodeaminase/cyclohydrolase family protein [Tumebacillus permanentifrigoris]PWK14809.1 formiminotetrahydrofolate cyclodeaminase [Tumebacillus permanentifrigoris]